MKIYTVIYTDDTPGRHDDPDRIFRTRDKREANTFCFGKRHYGEAATVTIEDVPNHVARRWGF